MKLILLFISIVIPITGDDIARSIESTKAPQDIKSTLSMKIIDSKGREKNKKIKTVSKDRSRMQILWLLEPARDKGISLLKIDYSDKPNEMRMWIPAIKKLRRISTNKQSGSFMGSDLSYEDLYNKNLSDFIYLYKNDQLVDGIDCYVVEIVPRDVTVTDYGKHISWISKEDFYILKEESFSKSDIKYKEKVFTYIKSNGYNVISSISVKNLIKGSSTILTFHDIQVDTNISDGLFHEKNLRRVIND